MAAKSSALSSNSSENEYFIGSDIFIYIYIDRNTIRGFFERFEVWVKFFPFFFSNSNLRIVCIAIRLEKRESEKQRLVEEEFVTFIAVY